MARARKVLQISAVVAGLAGAVTVLVMGAMSAVADRPSDDGPIYTIKLASPQTQPVDAPPPSG